MAGGRYNAGRRPWEDLDEFSRQYVETALWSTNDESDPSGGEPIDKNYDVSDVDDATIARMAADCEAFQRDNAADLDVYYDGTGRDKGSAGHDFWLTRNGHGAGFWDRGYGLGQDVKDALRRLTDASRAFGEVDLYVGDDAKVHQDGCGPTGAPAETPSQPPASFLPSTETPLIPAPTSSPASGPHATCAASGYCVDHYVDPSAPRCS